MTFNPWLVRLRRTMLLNAHTYSASSLRLAIGCPFGRAGAENVCVDREGVAR